MLQPAARRPGHQCVDAVGADLRVEHCDDNPLGEDAAQPSVLANQRLAIVVVQQPAHPEVDRARKAPPVETRRTPTDASSGTDGPLSPAGLA